MNLGLKGKTAIVTGDIIPVGRRGAPDDIATMAVFLSSPQSDFTTRANIVIDGLIRGCRLSTFAALRKEPA